MTTPTKDSDILADLFTQFAASFPPDNNIVLERLIFNNVARAGSEAPGVTYEDAIVAGRPCIWMRPKGAREDQVILFMHGGGFTMGSPAGHRHLAAHLASHCKTILVSVDYRLTPEHVFPAPIDDSLAVYQHLLATGFAPSQIVLAGDSCGGTLSTALPLAMQERALPAPAASISLSPWYDLTGPSATMTTNEQNDVLSSKAFIATLASRYLQGAVGRDGTPVDAAHPLVSPLLASDDQLRHLPPHWISCGGHDMLLDHGEKMAARLQALGVECVLEVHAGMQHVCEFMAGRADVADGSLARIGAWVRTKLA